MIYSSCSVVTDEPVRADLGKMIDANQFEELTNVYTLLKRTDALPELKVAFRDHVKVKTPNFALWIISDISIPQASGLQIVSNVAADEKMVDNLIVFRNKISTILKKCFAFDADFVTANSLAFEFFINKRENKPAEMMGELSTSRVLPSDFGRTLQLSNRADDFCMTTAKFLDSRLRIGNKGMSDDDLEASLNDVLALFRFTQGKDVSPLYFSSPIPPDHVDTSCLLRHHERCSADA